MTTRAQRWGSRYHAPADNPSPTMADIEARVYSLTYISGLAKHSIMVLAANQEQATQLGAIRLKSQGDLHPPAPHAIAEMDWADVAMKVGIASFETSEERNARNA